MPLSWNEIKSRALTFSRTWADAANEDSQGKPFWIDFFEIFGITNKRVATFEHAVKKLPGLKAKTDGFVDLFWPGMLLVEQKSRGKNLDAALTQALSYFPGILERDCEQLADVSTVSLSEIWLVRGAVPAADQVVPHDASANRPWKAGPSRKAAMSASVIALTPALSCDSPKAARKAASTAVFAGEAGLVA